MALKNVTVWLGGQAWKVTYACTLQDAHEAIAICRCTGSTSITRSENDTVIADVERIKLKPLQSVAKPV